MTHASPRLTVEPVWRVPALHAGARPMVLLLGADAPWRRAVEIELATQPATLLVAGSAAEAALHLAMMPGQFTHLLVQPAWAGPLLEDLLAAAPMAVVLDGEAGAGARRPGWLAARLQACARSDAPPLTAEDARRALDADGARVLFQPMVWLGDRKPGGMEALARLRDPTGRRLHPGQFLPAVEQAGLLEALTRAVVARALAPWNGPQLRALGMGVGLNLPLDLFMRPDLPDWLRESCAAAGLGPRDIVLELTETQPITDVARLGVVVTGLRRRGFRVSIDDVGPDSRDPRPLLDLPFTTVKLDMALVRATADSALARRYLRRVADAAHAGGMIVVAEGIEDAEIWGRVQALGADAGQGFAIARPMPAAAVPLWHEAWTGALTVGSQMPGPAVRGA